MGCTRLPFIALALGVLAVAIPSQAFAQDFEPPAHVSYAEGIVTLERETESQEAGAGAILLPGDRLRTSAGRAEILFPDGSSLAIDEHTVLDLLDRALLGLAAGRTQLTVIGAADPASALRYQIDTPGSSVSTEGPGEYRVAVASFPSGTETELSVLHGYAVIATDQDSVRVRSGEQSTARGGFAPSFPRSFNAARYDAFDQWAEQRRGERMGYRGASGSADYLPADLRMYGGTFDRYGAWQQEPVYGNVWYPTVAPAWRPYYHGSWSSVPGYGWTWTGLDRWAWPTHHYGRWGHKGARWFWIPGRRWGPAWVSWGAAPGYVGWCPLGFNNRPVFAMSISVGNAWNGWVAMPRGRFGARGAFVHREAVHHPSFGATPFITQAHAPVPAPLAPRNGRARGGHANVYRLGAPVPNESRGRTSGAVTEQRSTPSPPATGPGERRSVAASRSPQRAALAAIPSPGPEPATSPGARPGPSQSAVSSSPGRTRQGSMPRTAPPIQRVEGTDSWRRTAPGVSSGPRPGVVARAPYQGAPEPPTSPSSSGTGVIRTNPSRSGASAGVPTGPGGATERYGTVRRNPAAGARTSPPVVYPREAPPRPQGAAAPSREAPTRQQPAAAPSREASAPASSGAVVTSPRRGSSAGDSGRARRR